MDDLGDWLVVITLANLDIALGILVVLSLIVLWELMVGFWRD